jgi:hypothetical protein
MIPFSGDTTASPTGFEHFRNTRRLLSAVKGGFFLRKKPLERVVPDYTNSESAVETSLSAAV